MYPEPRSTRGGGVAEERQLEVESVSERRFRDTLRLQDATVSIVQAANPALGLPAVTSASFATVEPGTGDLASILLALGAKVNPIRGVLVSFVRDTLIGGSQPFDWTEPWPGAGLLTFRFQRLPVFTPVVPARDVAGRAEQITYDVHELRGTGLPVLARATTAPKESAAPEATVQDGAARTTAARQAARSSARTTAELPITNLRWLGNASM